MLFLVRKRRLRQAASRGKLCFSQKRFFWFQERRLRQAASRGKLCNPKEYLKKDPKISSLAPTRHSWPKKSACGKPPAEENCVFLNVFFPPKKVSFSGAIFPPKVFLENYKKMEAAMAAKRPWPQNCPFS